MIKAVKSFTCDRSKWGTGKLLDWGGCMCVLGQYAKACGVEDGYLRDRGRIPSQYNLISEMAQQPIYSINDRKENRHGLQYKEQRLINAFKRLGIKLRFVGKPANNCPVNK